MRDAVKAKSCGSITCYASRCSIAATEGNVMINANPTITRCVRMALTSLCSEITTPLGYDTRPSSSIPTAPTLTPPSNLSEAIDQCVGFLDPIQAAALLALKPDATAPGDASKMQSLFTNLLQHKSSTQHPRGRQQIADEPTPYHKATDYESPSTTGAWEASHTLTGISTVVNGSKP